MVEPEAFGYCWHRNTGEWYYGVHKGNIDDGYIGSGTKFKNVYDNTNPLDWYRTIEFRGTYDECLDWEADIVTQEMIDQPDCLNLKLGGAGGSVKGHTKSKLTRQRISFAMKDNKNGIGNKSGLGKTLSEEHKKKVSEGLRGNTNTKGRSLSEEHKRKISQANKGNQNCLGQKQSEETKAKRAESLRQYWRNKKENKLCS